jgi:hypothetical protein
MRPVASRRCAEPDAVRRLAGLSAGICDQLAFLTSRCLPTSRAVCPPRASESGAGTLVSPWLSYCLSIASTPGCC